MENRFILDKINMAIYDNQSKVWVCSVSTKRPDIFENKLNELLDLANRPIENELLEALEEVEKYINLDTLYLNQEDMKAYIKTIISKYKGGE